ncbi:MAG: insulinase family protein [Proteobacteria bacterium]|nr:insulinase family protein [Pseudomonadota bacterium]
MKIVLKKLGYISLFLVGFSQFSQANRFNTEEWQTANGAKVIFYQAMEVPMVNINLAFKAGSAYDGNQFGLSALTTNLMNQGNASKDASHIAEALADTGAQYFAESSRDMAILSLKSLSKEGPLQKAVNNFQLIINQPDFPKDAFLRERNQQILALAQVGESPDELANQLFFEKLYGSHPYAHPINGNKESLDKLSVSSVKDFYKKYFVASNATMVIVGAISSSKAHEIAEKLIGQLPKGIKADSIPLAKKASSAEEVSVDFPSTQTSLRVGQIGITHHDKDYFPLMVGNYILGGGALVSKLSTEIREKRGLTYSVNSQFIPMPGNGPFIINLATQNQKALYALELTQETLKDFINKGPSEEELQSAKQYLMGSFPLSLANNGTIANMLLKMAFYNLPKDYLDTYVKHINEVTHAQIIEAFKQHIEPNKMLTIIVGKK